MLCCCHYCCCDVSSGVWDVEHGGVGMSCFSSWVSSFVTGNPAVARYPLETPMVTDSEKALMESHPH